MISIMTPLMTLHPGFLLGVEATARPGAPVEAGTAVLEIVVLVHENNITNVACDGPNMHPLEMSPQKPRIPESSLTTQSTLNRLLSWLSTTRASRRRFNLRPGFFNGVGGSSSKLIPSKASQ